MPDQAENMDLSVFDAYRVDDEVLDKGAEVTLPRGVTARLREYGTPEFFAAFSKAYGDGREIRRAEEDVRATNIALVDHIIVSVEGITDRETLLKIVSDPLYSALRADILAASKRRDNFISRSAEAVKKRSPTSSKRAGSGSTATPRRGPTSRTSNTTAAATAGQESRAPA